MKNASVSARNFSYILFSGLLILALAHSIDSSAVAGQQDPSARRPTKVSDLVVEQDDSGVTVFITDNESGGIYKASWGSGDSMGLSGFQEIPKPEGLDKPAALAFRDGLLAICDYAAKGIFTVNLKTGETKHILPDQSFPLPKSIAISEQGVIAVGSDGLNAIFLIKPDGGFKKLNCEIHEAIRLNFVGNDLIALDEGANELYLIPGDAALSSDGAELKPLSLLPDEAKVGGPDFEDFAVHRGVYYLASKEQFLTFTRGAELREIPVLKKSFKSDSCSRIAATKDYLYTFDAETLTINRLPRPVPVSVNFELDPQILYQQLIVEHRAAQAYLYSYLEVNGLLPKTLYKIKERDTDIEQLLMDQKILIPNLSVEANKPIPKSIQAKAKPVLENLGCLLEYWDCKSPKAAKRLIAGKEIYLPSIPLKGILATTNVHLSEKTVNDYMEEFLPVEERAGISKEYLWRINPQLQTLESVLSRSRFIKVDPPVVNAESPFGKVIKYEEGRELILGDFLADLARCGIETAPLISEKPYTLPHVLTSTAVPENLPRETNAPGSKDKTPRLNVDEIQVYYKYPITVERISLPDLTGRMAVPENKTCLQSDSQADGFIAAEVLKVSGAEFRFKRNGEDVSLKESDLRQMAIAGKGQTDERGKWYLSVTDPYVIGYRLLPRGIPTDPGKWAPVSDPTVPNKETSQNILNMRGAIFLNLPYIRWQQKVYVNATDLNDKTSDLNQNMKAERRVFLLSEEELKTVSNSSYSISGPPVARGRSDAPDDTCPLTVVCENRKKLKEKINYLPMGLEDPILIGIAEKNGANLNHPDFINDYGENAWKQVSTHPASDQGGETQPAGGAAPNGASAGETELQIKNSLDNPGDHGTHVASLLAGRRKAPAPGLAPFVNLMLLDTKSISTGELYNKVRDAKTYGARIFSFSQTIMDDSSEQITKFRNMMALKTVGQKKTEGGFKDLLFVVAAGNERIDLCDSVGLINGQLPAFIGWRDVVKNVIVVGATRWNDKIWWEDDPTKKEGSNKCKRYVHILAPGGDEIFSAAGHNTYAPAKGTSLAVPQVTAAAAALKALIPQQGPETIKARLIYTTDWQEDEYNGWVLGGALNYGRAVWQPQENYFTYKPLLTPPPPPEIYRAISHTGLANIITFKDPGDTITAENGYFYETDDSEANLNAVSIPFGNILRIQFLPNGLYRVIYIDKDSQRLRILMDTQLSGHVRIGKIEVKDVKTRVVVRTVICPKDINDMEFDCKNGLDVNRILNYVAASPASAKF